MRYMCFNPKRAPQAIPTKMHTMCLGLVYLVSIPNGLHRPFRLYFYDLMLYTSLIVSIPNGLHRPFRQYIPKKHRSGKEWFQSQTGSTAQSNHMKDNI